MRAQLLVQALLALQASAKPANRHLLKRDNLMNPSDLPGNWEYGGCITDNTNGGRVMNGAYYQDGSAMTVESCVAFCDGKKFGFAGIEYSGECYCANVLKNNPSPALQSDCYMSCNGNNTEACGGPNRLSLYNNTASTNTGPIINPGPGNWTSLGCYNDTVGVRALPNNPYTPGGTNAATVGLCTDACASQGFKIAGVEYGGVCGNAFENYAAPALDQTTCSMQCNGNASEYCGGPSRLNVYSLLGWKDIGCYNDSVNSRTLGYAQYGFANINTVEYCQGVCAQNGFNISGVEYGGECYCDNAIENYGAPASDPDSCNVPCNGNAGETCGGADRLNMYSYRGAVPTKTYGAATTAATTTAAPTTGGEGITSTAGTGDTVTASDGNTGAPDTMTSTTSTVPASVTPVSAVSTAPTPSSTGTAANLPAGFSYKGCFIDGAQGRIFQNQQPDNQQLTIESCISTCSGMGYGVAAMEYGVQCFCDNFVRNNGSMTTDSDCNMACAGSSSEKCGAGNRLSVYSNSSLTIYVPPAVQKTNLPGSWAYQGCLTDIDGNRTFKYESIFDKNNSAQNCLSLCSNFGYNAGGMEYGRECYCGDMYNVVQQGATIVDDSQCNMPCTGNASFICGGGSRMSYYAWTGAPLTEWSFPTGNDAGAYEFLIGGVVIPLVTSAARNGKVTFVEKYGTGAPNTTGAYELDLAQLDNFTAAWRPMHVKTDVFCSASITLPDKAGRQINIGGWANDATYGIRLYWPDGSPGVWGTNDWQENVNEVALQAGRWYPSAMVMANGSILVVGGEEGSNGAAVPSLELLPRVGPVLYADYLDRTDPYNLYPYLAVLPSGGILIAYYNEARILDEVTLDTIKVLPNIPGAVNDFDGGRTYPFEGTAMLMPQSAPYTDPLTVLICGGSVPGPEVALDNCASIQPDADEPKWVIERMPSKRVMSCMTALPDGTYLILNGAQQGRAGFGLGSNPNLNAVLYDPSKPVNTRMSIMANTTVARLYHSEAVLLDDGRVLVSGSDPEDDTHPQEYRVEVFVPPYLLNGGARPTVDVAGDDDWAYGSSHTVAVGGAAVDRVSLIAAVGSTHGNSMGQRTLFPEFSCSGGSCTVTAPPNAHVSPPGWFQLFVLSGGVPSVAQWVRIGGDPGELGNWPDYPDFDVPGI